MCQASGRVSATFLAFDSLFLGIKSHRTRRDTYRKEADVDETGDVSLQFCVSFQDAIHNLHFSFETGSRDRSVGERERERNSREKETPRSA